MSESSIRGVRVLYISYNGMLDPLGQSQVLPYLLELSKLGVEITLLSFERGRAFTLEGKVVCNDLRNRLSTEGIDWHWLRYHQKFSLIATAFDVLCGIRRAWSIVRRKRIDFVHARSHIPATIGLAMKRMFDVGLLFDLRGLMADEYADAGHWKRGEFKFNLTKSMERRCFAASDGIVTLTNAIWPVINKWEGLSGRNVPHEVIPCCADLQRFKFDSAARQAKRRELGLEDATIVVYSGSIGGWYLNEEMADFFLSFAQVRPNAHFLWLTPSCHEEIARLMNSRGITERQYTVLAVSQHEVATYLSASDLGLAFIKSCVSKLASSPTKTAEYLGCGLPIVINSGVGDSDSLVTDEQSGVLVREFLASEYEKASHEILRFLVRPEETRARSREVAERLFNVSTVGIERYSRLYEKVADRPEGNRGKLVART